jgi:hypothetical protein
MRVEAWLFGITTVFLVLVTPAYWFITDAASDCHGGSFTDQGGTLGSCADWTGTSALVMTTLLTAMVTLYLGFHARRMDARPEDRTDGEIADGAGELGFFPPYSWWPFWCACTLGIIVLALAVTAWWMLVLGMALGVLALSGWMFVYSRGEHAH